MANVQDRGNHRGRSSLVRRNCRGGGVTSGAVATSNRDRRKAKQKARDQRRQYASSNGDPSYHLAIAAVATASRPSAPADPGLLAELVAGLGLAGGIRQVDRALAYALQDAVGHTFTSGWQPVDLVRVARREHGEPGVAMIVDVVAGRMREYPASTVDPRWAAQIGDLKAEVWWESDAGWVAAWAERNWAGRAQTVEVAVLTLRLLRSLAKLPVLVPPPGQARAGTDPRARGNSRPAPASGPAPASRAAAEASVAPEASARMLDRIRALLAKAESTTFPEEAETYTAKAQELMARHSIDAALLDASAAAHTAPVAVRIGVDAPYEGPKSMLLSVVATANRCRSVWSKEYGFNTVFGFETDLELVELLYTSLLVQATAAMTAQGSRHDRYGRSSTRSFRQSFLMAYADRIGERLSGATERASAEAAAEVGDSALLPVLAARDDAVRERVETVFPTLRQHRVQVRNRDGWESGRAAADRASLQPRRSVTA
jgi:hypothetical protein